MSNAPTEPEQHETAPAAEAAPEAAARAPLFRELDPRGKRLRALGTVLLVYHFAAVLWGGSAGPVRRFFAPAVAFYGDGLRMTNSWGMFGKPPSTTNVTLEGETTTGKRVVLTTTRAAERTFVERVRDVRIRKIQSKLSETGYLKRFGLIFLDYYCRNPGPHGPLKAVRAINHVHELRDDSGKVTRSPSKSTLLVRWCNDPSQKLERQDAPKDRLVELGRSTAPSVAEDP